MTLKGLSASYGEWIHYLLSEGVDQRVYGAPTGAMPRYDHLQAEFVQLGDRLLDYIFVRRHEVQTSDHCVQWHVGKTSWAWLQMFNSPAWEQPVKIAIPLLRT
jgi:hypothetical protein